VRLWVLLRREGWVVNKKLVYRLYSEEGLGIRRRKPRRRKSVQVREARVPVQRANETWSMDFMSDQLVGGQRFRLLTLVDNHSRESLGIEVGQRLTGDDVVRVLEQVTADRGKPQSIRVDNGKLCKPGIPTRTGLVRCQAAALGGSQRRPGNEPRGNRPRQVQERGLLVSQ
jgi:putative transposase